ncbi:MAG: GIY-YIG domain-containing protein [Virgibacillus proomii]
MPNKGYFGVYNNIEYEVTRDVDNNFLIMTDDPAKVTNDFVDKFNSGVYTKKIKKENLSELYYIKPQAIYKNKKFNVMSNEKDGKVYLGTGDAKLAREFNFDRTDKYYYEKWVPKEDVEIIEERKDIPIEKNR